MNREELTRAIRHFENVRDRNFITLTAFETDLESGTAIGSSIVYRNRDLYYNTAITALRSELDRVGCEYCNDGEAMGYRQDSLRRAGYIYLDGNSLTADLYSDSMAVAVCYCPMCGAELKEKSYETD